MVFFSRGEGKSTVMSLLQRFYDPVEGTATRPATHDSAWLDGLGVRSTPPSIGTGVFSASPLAPCFNVYVGIRYVSRMDGPRKGSSGHAAFYAFFSGAGYPRPADSGLGVCSKIALSIKECNIRHFSCGRRFLLAPETSGPSGEYITLKPGPTCNSAGQTLI